MEKAAYDAKTLSLFLLLVTSMIGFTWAHALGWLPFWLTVILGSLAMNLSFTVWHETSHTNFSRSTLVNHTVGVLASFFSVYPGYFARRREHLAHHRWEGNPEQDPVYPRIQGSALYFFPQLTWLTIQRAGRIDSSFLPLTEAQKKIDRLTLGVFALLVGLAIRYEFFLSLVAVFLIPRLVIFYLHAFYICYLPHARANGGFEKYRVAQNPSWWWRVLTVGQWAHGVHHRWPNIPWHQYSVHRARLIEEGVKL